MAKKLTQRLIERAERGDAKALWAVFQDVLARPQIRRKRGRVIERIEGEQGDLFGIPISRLDMKDAGDSLPRRGQK